MKPKAKAGDADKDAGPDVSVPIDALSAEFSKLLRKLKINGRKGLGFYTLRHVFETQAGESKDQVAVNSIMGHCDNSMAGVYREKISDQRLKDVVEVVRSCRRTLTALSTAQKHRKQKRGQDSEINST